MSLSDVPSTETGRGSVQPDLNAQFLMPRPSGSRATRVLTGSLRIQRWSRVEDARTPAVRRSATTLRTLASPTRRLGVGLD